MNGPSHITCQFFAPYPSLISEISPWLWLRFMLALPFIFPSFHDCFHFIWHDSIFQLQSLIQSSCPSISNWINLDFSSSCPSMSASSFLRNYSVWSDNYSMFIRPPLLLTAKKNEPHQFNLGLIKSRTHIKAVLPFALSPHAHDKVSFRKLFT